MLTHLMKFPYFPCLVASEIRQYLTTIMSLPVYRNGVQLLSVT